MKIYGKYYITDKIKKVSFKKIHIIYCEKRTNKILKRWIIVVIVKGGRSKKAAFTPVNEIH